MCRSRPSLPRAALVRLPERRRITLHKLLFSASSARTVLFLLFSCSSSSVLRRPPSYPATGGHHRDRPARPSTPPCPGGSSASGGAAQRRTTALQSATTSASRRRQVRGLLAHPCLSDTAPPPCHQDEPSLGHCTSPKRQVWGANTRLCQQRVWRRLSLPPSGQSWLSVRAHRQSATYF